MIETDVIIPHLSPDVSVPINGFPARMRVSHQQPGKDYSVCTFTIDAEPGPIHSVLVKYNHPPATLRGVWKGGVILDPVDPPHCLIKRIYLRLSERNTFPCRHHRDTATRAQNPF